MFPVTQYQYEKLMGANPSGCKTAIEGNKTALRPVENVSWTTLRGSATPVENLVPDATGTFLQRLNALTLRGGAAIPVNVPRILPDEKLVFTIRATLPEGAKTGRLTAGIFEAIPDGAQDTRRNRGLSAKGR